MSEESIDLRELMDKRARTYGMLARLFREEVDRETLAELQGMRFPASTGNATVDEGYHLLYAYLKAAWDDSITELAVDFRLMMQEARAEVLQTLRENNLKRGAWTEGEDHVALEFEFMQRMSLRASASFDAGDEDAAVECLRTQRTFLQEHLLNWLPLLVGDMRLFARTMFYQGLAQLAIGFAEEDDALLTELLDSVDVAA